MRLMFAKLRMKKRAHFAMPMNIGVDIELEVHDMMDVSNYFGSAPGREQRNEEDRRTPTFNQQTVRTRRDDVTTDVRRARSRGEWLLDVKPKIQRNREVSRTAHLHIDSNGSESVHRPYPMAEAVNPSRPMQY